MGLILLLISAGAAAQSAGAVTAGEAPQPGRDQPTGNPSQDCLKLAENPIPTTHLIKLAECYEQNRKFASASATWNELSTHPQAKGNDFETMALRQVNTLAPLLSTLRLAVDPQAAAIRNLTIRLNDTPIGQDAWNVDRPMDGGTYRVVASAPGRLDWSQLVTVQDEAARVQVTVPALEVAPATSPAKSSEPAAPSREDHRTPSPSAGEKPPLPWGPLEWTGVATAGAGLVSGIVAGYFLGSALNSKAKADCDQNNLCSSPQDVQHRADAVASANTATGFAVAGALLAAGGVTLFIVGRRNARADQGHQVSVSFDLPEHAAVLRVSGLLPGVLE